MSIISDSNKQLKHYICMNIDTIIGPAFNLFLMKINFSIAGHPVNNLNSAGVSSRCDLCVIYI